MTDDERKHLTIIGILSTIALSMLIIGIYWLNKQQPIEPCFGSLCLVLSGFIMYFIYGCCWIPLWIDETSKEGLT